MACKIGLVAPLGVSHKWTLYCWLSLWQNKVALLSLPFLLLCLGIKLSSFSRDVWQHRSAQLYTRLRGSITLRDSIGRPSSLVVRAHPCRQRVTSLRTWHHQSRAQRGRVLSHTRRISRRRAPQSIDNYTTGDRACATRCGRMELTMMFSCSNVDRHTNASQRVRRNSEMSLSLIVAMSTSQIGGDGSATRTSVFGRRTFPDLCPIYGWQVTISWVDCPLWICGRGQLSFPSLRGR